MPRAVTRAFATGGRAIERSWQLRKQLEGLKVSDPGAAGYPSGFDALPLLAEMLGAGFPIKCVAIQAPGAYDTHAQPAEAARRRPQAHR